MITARAQQTELLLSALGTETEKATLLEIKYARAEAEAGAPIDRQDTPLEGFLRALALRVGVAHTTPVQAEVRRYIAERPAVAQLIFWLA